LLERVEVCREVRLDSLVVVVVLEAIEQVQIF
jgi:hypothetical protein